MATLPSRIREACGVERFDVADTQNALVMAVEVLVAMKMKKEHAVNYVAAIFKLGKREITTPHV